MPLISTQEWDREASHNNVDRLDPANMVLGRSKASFNISSQVERFLISGTYSYPFTTLPNLPFS